MHSTPIQLQMIIGSGGMRADFVCGWLGTLPTFLNNNWTLDISTGASTGHFLTKKLDFLPPDIDVNQYLQAHHLLLSANPEFLFAGPMHGTNLKYQYWKDYINQGLVKFAAIEPRQADISKIHWEFIVKTFLRKERIVDRLFSTQQKYGVDQLMDSSSRTDSQRIQFIESYIARVKPIYPCTNMTIIEDFKPAILEYPCLFNKGGSRYLCSVLGLTATEQHHLYWDSMVGFADSPEVLDAFGKTWRKSDYFN